METNFEVLLLKKLIYNTEFFSKVVNIIKSSHFKSIGNTELFKLIKNHYKNYNQIPSLVELVASVKNVQNAEIRNTIIESLQSVNNTDEVQNTKFMIDETVSWVKDSMYLKALEIGSEGLMKKDDALKMKAQQILDERAKISVDSDLGLDFDDIDTMLKYYQERNIGILTQHKELNKRLGTGFLPGTLNIILASAGIGKSLLMTDLISGMIQNKKNILLISLEMAEKEIMKRVHANALDLKINQLSDLSKTEGEIKRIKNEDPLYKELIADDIINAYNRLKTSGNSGKLFVKAYPAGSFSALQLEALITSYKNEKNIEFDMVYIDYLGIMKSDLISPSAGLYSYLKSIGEEVRASATRLKLPIVSASQLNRGVFGKEAADVDNSSISDSMGTAMTADFMLFLLQNEEMKLNKQMVLKCTKNRYTGRTDTWMMGVDYSHMRFNDVIMESAANYIQELKDNGKSDDDFDFIPKEIVNDKVLIEAEKFANSEVKEIQKDDYQNLKSLDNIDKDPLKDEIQDIFASLLK
jgi:replicative DNA helicase